MPQPNHPTSPLPPTSFKWSTTVRQRSSTFTRWRGGNVCAAGACKWEKCSMRRIFTKLTHVLVVCAHSQNAAMGWEKWPYLGWHVHMYRVCCQSVVGCRFRSRERIRTHVLLSVCIYTRRFVLYICSAKCLPRSLVECTLCVWCVFREYLYYSTMCCFDASLTWVFCRYSDIQGAKSSLSNHFMSEARTNIYNEYNKHGLL